MKILLGTIRRSKGYTLLELARRTGFGKSTINNIENGKTSPTLDQMELLAAALEISINDLFESEYN